MNKSNLKATWKLIGMLINRKKNRTQTLSKIVYHNKSYTGKQNICNVLNEYFTNVGPNLADKIPNHQTNPTSYITRPIPNSFVFRSILVHEVSDQIQNININKATIGIPSICVKLAGNHLSEALTTIYNNSIAQGTVPDILKISKVTPIDKGGDTTDPTNFRPISILSIFTQIFEKLVCKQLTNYIEKYEILSKLQFGFRKGTSTEHAIGEITENFKQSIDNNKYTCAIFLDFAKAFDTVNHLILLAKLEKYGIRGMPLKWFTSYLTNRQQYVALGDTQSSLQTVRCGIPQGSSLGPLLFLLYINDIPNSSNKLSFRIFADDTNIFTSSSNLKQLETTVNEELKKVKHWCNINKLSLNLEKTNYMIIKSPRKKEITINIFLRNNDGTNYSLKRKDHIRYLGVMIDDSVSWKYHIAFISSKISRNIGIFAKLRHFVSLQQLKQLYYNLIYPYLSYAITAWGSTYKSHLKILQTKQNHIVRLMFFAKTYGEQTESAQPLINLLEILNIENVFKLHALKFAHHWHTKALPNIFDTCLQYAKDVHRHNTRYAAKENFHRTRGRTNTGKQTISYNATVIWEKLPPEIKQLKRFSFIKEVKKHLLSTQSIT